MNRSGLQPAHRPRERNRLAHVVDPADPCQGPLQAEPESAVRDGSVLTEIQIPIEYLAGKAVGVDLLLEEGQIGRSLAPSDDFPVPLGREDIHSKGQPVVIRIALHVEGLYFGRISVHDNRTIEMPSEHRFVTSSKVAAPLE